jgi:uncharacterized protein (DUF2345 family)
MANQSDNLQIVENGMQRFIGANDNLQISSTVEFQSDVRIGGDFVIDGDAISIELERVRTQDNHILLNDGYTTVAAQTGGLVVNYLPTATNDTVAATGFTAGVAAVSNPTVNTTAATAFSAGDLILVSGAADEGNNGLYEVLSHAANLLTIKGIGTTATVEDFTDTQFVTDTTAQGTITKVNVSILRAGTDGDWETAKGSTTPLVFTDLADAGGNTLQEAYVAGNQITTSAGEGDVIIGGTEEVQITATSGLNLDAPFDFDSTSFDVQMTGSNGFSIDGTDDSNVSVTAGNLTLSTITSGNVDITSAGDINLLATGNDIDLDAATLTADFTGAFSIDGSGSPSNVTNDGGDLQLTTTTSGNVSITAADDIDLLATGSQIDMDAATLDVDLTSTMAIDAVGNSNLTIDSGDLTLSTTTSGNIDITAADDINLSAVGSDIEMDAATLTADFTSGFSIDADTASNLSVTTGNLTISTITSGNLDLTSAGDSTYTVPDPSATAFKLTDGTSDYIIVDSTSGAEKLDLPQFTNLSGGAGIILETNDAVVVGNIVQVEPTAGKVGLADADTGTLNDALAIGVSMDAAAATNDIRINTIQGTRVPVKFTSAPAAASNGLPVWLSATAGQASMTAPTGTGVVTVVLGLLQGADGITDTPEILWMPQIISQGPAVS